MAITLDTATLHTTLMPDFRVNIQVFEEFQDLVSPLRLRQVAEQALMPESVDPSSTLSVLIADDDLVKELNGKHRGLDETTDVLSFSFSSQGRYYGEGEQASEWRADMDFPLPSGERGNLGEVIISYPQAERQAALAGHSTDREMAHLVAHGVLHILGYDHVQHRDERAMRAREETALARVFDGCA